jgi:hypothetical protein
LKIFQQLYCSHEKLDVFYLQKGAMHVNLPSSSAGKYKIYFQLPLPTTELPETIDKIIKNIDNYKYY